MKVEFPKQYNKVINLIYIVVVLSCIAHQRWLIFVSCCVGIGIVYKMKIQKEKKLYPWIITVVFFAAVIIGNVIFVLFCDV